MQALSRNKTSCMKKVLIITYYWPPSGGPGVQRCVKFAKLLPEFGYEPIIVTVDPDQASYPLIDASLINEVSPNIQVHKTKTFEPFKIYSNFIPGAELPKPGFANESNVGVLKKIARFIRGNFFIPDARIGWNAFALKKCRKIIQEENITAILSSSPPHSTQLIAMKLSQETGIPWIADLRDPWTDIYYNRNFYRLEFARKKDARLERMILENANIIITVSETIKELFKSKSAKINPEKIHIIPNGYDILDFPDTTEESRESFTITYTGTMSDDYPISPFIKTIETFLTSKPQLNIKFKVIGKISEDILNQLNNSKLSEILTNLGYLNHAETIKMMRKASALLLIIPDVSNNEGIITGKLFEYLAARRPIICYGPVHGDASKIISKCESGRTFDYNDITKASKWIYDTYTQWNEYPTLKSGNSSIEEYSRQNQAKVLSEIINTFI